MKMENEIQAKKGGLTEPKRFSVTYNKVFDPSKKFEKDVIHIGIYKKKANGKMILYRHFVKTEDGTICELEEGIPFTVDEHPLLEIWPEQVARNLSEHSFDSENENEQAYRRIEEEKMPGESRISLNNDFNRDMQDSVMIDTKND